MAGVKEDKDTAAVQTKADSAALDCSISRGEGAEDEQTLDIV